METACGAEARRGREDTKYRLRTSEGPVKAGQGWSNQCGVRNSQKFEARSWNLGVRSRPVKVGQSKMVVKKARTSAQALPSAPRSPPTRRGRSGSSVVANCEWLGSTVPIVPPYGLPRIQASGHGPCLQHLDLHSQATDDSEKPEEKTKSFVFDTDKTVRGFGIGYL